MRQALGRDAQAGVDDPDQHRLAVGHRRQLDLPTGPVVLDGVGQQVDQHLAQAHRVGQHQARHRAAVQVNAGGLRIGGHQRQRGLDEGRQRHRLPRHPQFAGLGGGQVQHIVDQRQQMAAGLVDVGQPAPLLIGVDVALAQPQQLRKAQHRVQRRAQFVADARHGLRHGLRLGLAGGQRPLALAQRLGGHMGLGAVPVDADAAVFAA